MFVLVFELAESQSVHPFHQIQHLQGSLIRTPPGSLGALYQLPKADIEHAEALAHSLCHLSPGNPVFRETIIDLIKLGVSSKSYRQFSTNFVVDALILQQAPTPQLEAATDIAKFEAIPMLLYMLVPLIDGPEKASLARDALDDVIACSRRGWVGAVASEEQTKAAQLTEAMNVCQGPANALHHTEGAMHVEKEAVGLADGELHPLSTSLSSEDDAAVSEYNEEGPDQSVAIEDFAMTDNIGTETWQGNGVALPAQTPAETGAHKASEPEGSQSDSEEWGEDGDFEEEEEDADEVQAWDEEEEPRTAQANTVPNTESPRAALPTWNNTPIAGQPATGEGSAGLHNSQYPETRGKAAQSESRDGPQAAHWGVLAHGQPVTGASRRTWLPEELSKSSTPVLDLLYGDEKIPGGDKKRKLIQRIILGLRARCGPLCAEVYTDQGRRKHLVGLNMMGNTLGGDLVRVSRRQLQKKGQRGAERGQQIVRAEFERLLRRFALANEKDFPELLLCDKKSW